jgi:3-hydroxybutyryl-CoA dehydrogenase
MARDATFFEKVAVVGAGTMGNGIAQTFATCGVNVRWSTSTQKFLEKGVANVRASLDKFVKKGALTAAKPSVRRASSLHELDMDVRKVRPRASRRSSRTSRSRPRCSSELDAAHGDPRRILASNTSSISITVIAAKTKRADRVIGMHFMNPVPLMKLVEVIRGKETSDATATAVETARRSARQDPGARQRLSRLRRQPRADADDQRGRYA